MGPPGRRAPSGAALPALPEERYRAHRAVRALLDAVARQQPVVVMLDDLQWADGASIELAAHLLRRPSIAPVLLAMAFRTGQVPVDLSAALEAATRHGESVELAPVPLSESEADALLDDLHPDGRAEAFRQSGGTRSTSRSSPSGGRGGARGPARRRTRPPRPRNRWPRRSRRRSPRSPLRP